MPRPPAGADTPASIYDLPYDELAAVVGADRAPDLFRRIYRGDWPPPPDLDLHGLAGPQITRTSVSRGSMSAKHLFTLADGSGAVEAVRIRRRTGWTACVSSQVGCAMGCRFCASGRLGLRRHLRPGEIVEQVLALQPVNRIVFMGIGEPLHNFDGVLAAIRLLRDRRGRALPTSGVTISTIGPPAGLRRLREEHLKINLTISLHATTDETRRALIPGARKHEIAEVLELSQSWARRHRRTVTYVYLLLPGINDRDADADRLAGWLRGRPARVNLMRWNPVEGGDGFARADDRTLTRFRDRLRKGGVPVTVRDTQGRDVDAACGQLWLRHARGAGAAQASA